MAITAQAMRKIAMGRVELDLEPIYDAIKSAAKNGAFSIQYIFSCDGDVYTQKNIARNMAHILENSGFEVGIIEYDDKVHFNISW